MWYKCEAITQSTYFGDVWYFGYIKHTTMIAEYVCILYYARNTQPCNLP